jgi:hypothetical protein
MRRNGGVKTEPCTSELGTRGVARLPNLAAEPSETTIPPVVSGGQPSLMNTPPTFYFCRIWLARLLLPVLSLCPLAAKRTLPLNHP